MKKLKRQNKNKSMKSTLKNMVIVLLTITLISSAAVGVVYQLTIDPIAAANAKKLDNAIKQVMPKYENLEPTKNLDMGEDDAFILYTGKNGNDVAGYAIEAYSKRGYSGTLKLLIGFTPNGEINKVAVISHAETPGLGAKIDDSESHFVTQFEGKNPAIFKMSVKKDGGEVDAITASTITSRAYVDAIARAHEELMKIING